MTIETVLKELETRKRMYGINEFKACLNEIGNPQNQLKCVHIAGTNGKGSTANFIHSVYKQSYKIGLFTSPYLIKHNDRIRVNDEWISDEEIIYYYKKYNDLWLKYQLSSFEIDMFIAIMHFISNKVDFCIFEVGLGGLLDATNVVCSFLSIITNISFDHMEYLGYDLENIARNKAGIIKPNSTFITLDKQHEYLYQEKCRTLNTKCIIIKELPTTQNSGVYYEYKGYEINLKMQPSYQLDNSFLALNAIIEMQERYPIQKKMIEKGISEAFWRGRFEKISEHPLVYVDGAHNVAGIKALIQTLKLYNKVKILFSALKDKEYKTMLQMLQNNFEDVTVTVFDFYRALDKTDLEAIDDIKFVDSAKAFLKQNQHYDGVIVICGSLYFISSILKEEKIWT